MAFDTPVARRGPRQVPNSVGAGNSNGRHLIAVAGNTGPDDTTAPPAVRVRSVASAPDAVNCGGGSTAAGTAEGDGVAVGARVVARGDACALPMSLSRVRHVFQGTTSALVYRYFLGKGDVARADALVPLLRQGRPTAYVTDELKAIRMFALSTGGTGLSEKARADYYNSVAQTEAITAATSETVILKMEDELATSSDHSSSRSGDSSSDGPDTSSASTAPSRTRRTKKESLRKRLRKAIADAKASIKNVKGPLTSAFPTAAAFVASLKGEQDRCLSEMKWQVTHIVDGASFDFFSVTSWTWPTTHSGGRQTCSSAASGTSRPTDPLSGQALWTAMCTWSKKLTSSRSTPMPYTGANRSRRLLWPYSSSRTRRCYRGMDVSLHRFVQVECLLSGAVYLWFSSLCSVTDPVTRPFALVLCSSCLACS